MCAPPAGAFLAIKIPINLLSSPRRFILDDNAPRFSFRARIIAIPRQHSRVRLCVCRTNMAIRSRARNSLVLRSGQAGSKPRAVQPQLFGVLQVSFLPPFNKSSRPAENALRRTTKSGRAKRRTCARDTRSIAGGDYSKSKRAARPV